MAADPNPELRAQLVAALERLAPQIRGLNDLAKTSISAELKADIDTEAASREEWTSLIMAVLAALDQAVDGLGKLEGHGYPNFPNTEIPRGLMDELRGEEGDLDSAVAVFDVVPPASKIEVVLGDAETREV